MKRITTILLATFLLTGCTLESNSTGVTDNIESSANKNMAPPTQIYNIVEYEVTAGETLTIKPNDIAKDIDGDKIYFNPEEVLENDQMKINIKRDYIECEISKDIIADFTETFSVYVTDGMYRTQIEINITMVETVY